MKRNILRTFFARMLVVLQLVQLATPQSLLFATPKEPAKQKSSLGLPSRKVFKEVAESWEGLKPTAFIKNTSNISAGSSFDSTIRLVGSQQKTLSINKKNKAIAEALQFLNNLALPGKALEPMNCSKRMMSDLQMFHEKGLFKSFNRTILSLGKVLQMSQFYQGAESQKEAEDRRDFITGLLRTPNAARAIGVRIRCFGKYENQFLRQTMTLRNESLEQKIRALEPSKLFGPLRNSPAFIRWHSRISENMFFEIGKNAYMLFAAYTLVNLFARSWAQSLPGRIKDATLSGDLLKSAGEALESAQDAFTIHSKKESSNPDGKITLSEEDKSQIRRDIARELTSKVQENLPGARYSILYRMGSLFFGTATRQGIFEKSAQHFVNNLPAAAGSIAVGPFQGIPAFSMLLKKATALVLNEQKKKKTLSQWQQRVLNLSEKEFPVIPSLSAQTWEEGIDLFSTIPEHLASATKEFISKINSSKQTHKLFWDGNPTTVKTKTTLQDFFNYINPLRSALDHGADNKKAFDQTVDGIKKATTPEVATATAHVAAGDGAYQDASTAAKAEVMPGYGRAKNFSLNPLKWVFGTQTMNIFYGNIPYIGWLRILTGNTGAYWKEAKLFGSACFNGLEALANNGGLAYKKPLTTFTAKDGTTYSITLAPGAFETITGLKTAAEKKELPVFALFSVQTTNPDGSVKYLSHAELRAQDGLLNELSTYLEQNAERLIKEKLKPLSFDPEKSEFIKNKQIISRLIEGYAGFACILFATVYTLSNVKYLENTMITETLDEYMFSSLKPAVALAEMTRQISHILENNQLTIPLPKSLKQKLAMLGTSATSNCKTFTKLAQNKMFLKANKPILFGDYGTLRYAYKLTSMPDVKRWLSICATFMAEVDSYLAIARLVAEHKDAPNYFYPITFINEEQPQAHLSGFWLPLIGAYKSIPNDLTIGNPAHILITGLNGGGKSFALKGLLFTILMSHAFGYGPVKKGSMTFFNKIITHLSTTDNAAEGESCWIAEAKSMGRAIHAMQAPHEPGDRILYIGDELGSGTASAASIQAVASLMDIALEQPHVASIITTHLRPLTELEYITNGKIHNYRVGGTVSETGVIQRKFQLERGRANLNIAELIVNQLLEHGEQQTTPSSNQPSMAATAA